MPLSTIFQLYRGGKCFGWRKPEYPAKTTDLPEVTQKRYHKMFIEYTSPWARFELTTLCTGCIGSYKSIYHTINTTPGFFLNDVHLVLFVEWEFSWFLSYDQIRNSVLNGRHVIREIMSKYQNTSLSVYTRKSIHKKRN